MVQKSLMEIALSVVRGSTQIQKAWRAVSVRALQWGWIRTVGFVHGLIVFFRIAEATSLHTR